MDDRMDYTDQEQLLEETAEAPAPAPVSYADMTDEEVVAQCRTGDAVAVEYLLNKYKNFVRSKARSYFLIGAALGRIFYQKRETLLPAVSPENPIVRFFSFFGKHSLLFYLLHQPVMAGILTLYTMLL